RPIAMMLSSSRVRAATSSYRPRVVRSAIDSASRRARRSRFSRRSSRSTWSATWPLGDLSSVKLDHQRAGIVAAEHAGGLLDADGLGVVGSGALDQSFGKRAQPPARRVA